MWRDLLKCSKEALAFCAEVVDEFESILSNLKQSLDKKAGRHKGRRTQVMQWASCKVLLEAKALDVSMTRLERAKSLIGLAIECHSL